MEKKKKKFNIKKKKKTYKNNQFGLGLYDNAFLNQIIGNENEVYIEDPKCETKDCCYRKDPYIDLDAALKGNFENELLKKKYNKLLKDYKNKEFDSYLCFVRSELENQNFPEEQIKMLTELENEDT